MTRSFNLILLATAALAACGKTTETANTPPAAAPAIALTASPTTGTTSAALAVPPPAPAAAPSSAPAAHAAMPADAAPLIFPAPGAAQKPAAKTNTRVANFAGLEADIPLSWVPTPPANSMRLAEFQAPIAGQETAEAVVFFFPPGQGGPQDMNIARWASQFTNGKGAPITPVVSKTFVNNMAVTRIELAGSYSRGVGMGTTEGAIKANQVLLAAIITTPTQGNVTFHFFGPQASVKKQKESFEAMLKSIRFKG